MQTTFQNVGLKCIPYGGDCLPSADLPWMNQSIWLRVDEGERETVIERESEQSEREQCEQSEQAEQQEVDL